MAWNGKNIRQALCFNILTRSGSVIAQSTVKAVPHPLTPELLRELERFDADVHGELDTQDTIRLCSALDCCQEARKFAHLDDEDCEVGRK